MRLSTFGSSHLRTAARSAKVRRFGGSTAAPALPVGGSAGFGGELQRSKVTAVKRRDSNPRASNSSRCAIGASVSRRSG
jgi:hypothetical protein